MSTAKSKTRVRVRSVGRRRRYRPAGIERYALESRMEPLYVNCRSVPELRKRFQQFANDDALWKIIEQVHDNSRNRDKTLDALEKRCKEIARRPIQ